MASVVEQRVAADRRFVADYEARRSRGELAGPGWLQQLREAAVARFAETGFPTTRDEEWRHTPITPIVDTSFVQAEPVRVEANVIAPFRFAETAAELVFVNGHFVPALSRAEALPAGLHVAPIAETLSSDPGALEPWLHDVARESGSAFAPLNTAFLEDGAFVRIDRNAVIAGPVHLLFYSTVTGAPSVSHPRVVVIAGEHSEARVIETYAGPDDQVYFTNAVTEYYAGARAVVDHYKIQLEGSRGLHMGAQLLRTSRESAFSSHNFVLSGALVRNDIGAVLGGEGGDTTLNGLYLAGGAQLVDTHTTIDHALPHNGSHELYKGILGGRARGVFNGKIVVRPDAQKTDAKQTNKALLLSDNAQINTKPQLEIFADDVKCTHGATIGQLDKDMLFYLRARGLGLAEARGMLIRGFAGDVVKRVKVAELRERLDREIMTRIPIEGK
jgi:Fe-S cluster assembly protein SufD